MLVDLLFHRQNVLQFGIVIAGSIGSVVEIRKFHPDTFLYEDLNPTTLEQFWDRVRSINGKQRRRGLPMVNFYIILDDTGFDDRMWSVSCSLARLVAHHPASTQEQPDSQGNDDEWPPVQPRHVPVPSVGRLRPLVTCSISN